MGGALSREAEELVYLEKYRKRTARFVRGTLASLAAACALAAVLNACASEAPEPPSSALRSTLGRIGIAQAPEPPAIHIVAVPANVADGAANGAGAAVAGSVNGCLEVDPTGICALGALIASPYTAVGGAIYGATTASTEEDVQAASRAIHAALASEPFQNSMAEQVVRATTTAGLDFETHFVGGVIPPDVQQDTTVRHRRDPDTLLEVRVLEVRLGRRPAVNPALHLQIRGRARFLRERDRIELYQRNFSFRSEEGMEFREWGAANAAALHQALAKAYQRLATRMVSVLFVESPAPHDQAEE